MINLTTLPKSFWGYALESVARILNMVPIKKVERTPYEIWHGKAPKLSYLKDTQKEMMGYYFYYPLENKIFVARNAEFFEKSLMVQEANGSHGLLESSGSNGGLELIQEEDTLKILAKSARIPQALDKYRFYADVEEYELEDLNEPPNYKVDLPPNGRTVGSKWIFKKKTNMDGNVHTFKARLVAKGYTQTYGVDYGETFSHVADIRAIRILLAIVAFYDYEIWQIDVKTAFLNGHLRNNVTMLQEVRSWLCKCFSMKELGEAAYVLGIKIIRDRSKRLIALSQSVYLEKILKNFWMENSKKGYTPIIEKLDYRKSHGAKTPSEVQRMQRVPYASAIAELKVSCYADASFQTDKDDTKSQTRYMFVLNGGAVDWKSAKQSTTAMSSTEAEYIVAAGASMEAVWMRKFIDGLGNVMPSNKRPMEMLCDNEPTIAIANDPRILKGTRHFQRKYHYIREVI
ncbi:retrotransposon protein, putative, ty1-copia subclass [Tanacetum coccineum]